MPSSPSKPDRKSRIDRLIARPFAHRGLHHGRRIENSRAAFQAAINAGHGIELDVQASLYGLPFVFHDSEIDRLTSERGPLIELQAQDVERIRLRGSEETIPRLGETLALIAGQVPLLIEVKARGRSYHQLCYWVAKAVCVYDGPVAVMSFNPRVGRWFSRFFPEVLRGLVVTEKGKPQRGRFSRRLAAWWSRPDFLAYDIRDLPSTFAGAQRRRGLKILTWTCRSADDRARASAHADQIIYEVVS